MMDVHVFILTSFFIFFFFFSPTRLFLSFIRLHLLFESKRKGTGPLGLSFRFSQRPATATSDNKLLNRLEGGNLAGLEQQTEEL